MKYISELKRIVFIILLMTSLFSCGKWPVNGKLDGRWQLIHVEYHDDNSVMEPEFIYYDFQLDLLHLTRTGGEEYKGIRRWARFTHINDSLHISIIDGNDYYVNLFCIGDTIQHFEIIELSKKRMEINSDYARLMFRKF